MAILTDSDRKEIWTKFMSDVSAREEKFGAVNKHQIKDLIDAVDQWISDNLASFNSALPEPAKTQLTGKQKFEIFMAVAQRRWEVT